MIPISYLFSDTPSLHTLLEEHFNTVLEGFMENQLSHYASMNAAPTIIGYSLSSSIKHLFPESYPEGQMENIFRELAAALKSDEQESLSILAKYVLYELIKEETDIAYTVTGTSIFPLPKRLKEILKETLTQAKDHYQVFQLEACINHLEDMQNYHHYLFQSTDFLALKELAEPESGAQFPIDWNYQDILTTRYKEAEKEKEALKDFLSHCAM